MIGVVSYKVAVQLDLSLDFPHVGVTTSTKVLNLVVSEMSQDVTFTDNQLARSQHT